MTNANVASVVRMGKNRILTVQYKGGKRQVLIPEDAAIDSYSPSDRSDHKSGVPLFVNSQRQAEGSLTALRVKVGLNGQVPPM